MKMSFIIYIVIGAIILGGLFFVFKPKTQNSITPNSQVTTGEKKESTRNEVTPQSNKKTFDLAIKNKQIVSGEQTLKVNQEDEVTIMITSDVADEFHLHAYDKIVKLEPNIQATLTFTANLSGRYPFELEQSGTELGFLEVQPK